MNESLSIILPVCNAEAILERSVAEVLEVVSELATRIELLIIDNGSTDNTEEVAIELARCYPQIRSRRHARKIGEMAAAKLGVERTSGDIILIHDVNSPLSSELLNQLWAMRSDEELVFARPELPTEGQANQTASTGRGTQMLRRRAVEELRRSPRESLRINRVTRTDMADASHPAALLQQLTEPRRKARPDLP